MNKWMYYLVIAVLIGAIAGGYAVNRYYLQDEEKKEVMTVEEGDTVTVHYTGWLEDERIYDDERIFDTSREEIPGETTITFQERTRGDPFKFTVGDGQVIEGWEENVVGMKKGQTKIFTVPANKAYDTRSEDLVFEVEKQETVPVYHEMNKDEFTTVYEIQPNLNMVVEDVFWGWNTSVISVEDEVVELKREPKVDEIYRTYKQDGPGWKSKVLSVDSTANDGEGEIVVEHYVDKPIVIDSEHLGWLEEVFRNIPQQQRQAGQNGNGKGIVVDVGDTIRIDFNEEVTGKELRFKISVTDIQKAED
ncbi:MAG: FKBP-type peptidyl-prolyl cis-trans isomerase [Thermoplasmata archaeon]